MSVELIYASPMAEQPALTGFKSFDRTISPLHAITNSETLEEPYHFGYDSYSGKEGEEDFDARVAIVDTLDPYVEDDVAFMSLCRLITPDDEHLEMNATIATLDSTEALTERLQASVPEIDRYRVRNQLATLVTKGIIDPLHHIQTTELFGFNDGNRWPRTHRPRH